MFKINDTIRKVLKVIANTAHTKKLQASYFPLCRIYNEFLILIFTDLGKSFGKKLKRFND